ncbi:MAG: GGDEF domain-containing protein [Vicinamibacterales bacterium]
MRLFGRQDVLLIAGLFAALVIIFSEPLTRLLDYTRDIERQSGLALTPALIVLTFVYLIHQLRKRNQVQAQAAAAEAAKREAVTRAQELERLVAFGHALARSLDHDSIRTAVEQYLPRVAGTDDLWVVLRQDNGWEALAGDTRGAEHVVELEGFDEQLIGGTRDGSLQTGQNVGFPLLVGGTAVGVLGVRPPEGGLGQERQRALEASAALLAVSLKNAQLFREVRENSLRDSLTGCFSRAHSMEVIDAELRRARRSQAPVSLIMFDLDHFKDVNDRFGHLCGDAVLAAVGKRMREVLRGSDLKCRYGGEEFLVLLPETPLAGARRVAETLRREIADRPVPWAGEALTVTASFGLTQAAPGEVSIQALIARADAALYRAKDDGRNCVRIAADSLALIKDDKKPNLA